MSTEDLAEQYAKAWHNAIADGDIAHWEAFFDPSFVLHPGAKDVSLEAYRQHEIDMHQHAQVITMDIKYVTSDRSLFALEFSGHFRLTGDLAGHPGTAGKEAKSHALCLFRVKNGKITEEWGKTTVTGLTSAQGSRLEGACQASDRTLDESTSKEGHHVSRREQEDITEIF